VTLSGLAELIDAISKSSSVSQSALYLRSRWFRYWPYQVLLSMALVGLILMHSGREAASWGGLHAGPSQGRYKHRRAQSHEVGGGPSRGILSSRTESSFPRAERDAALRGVA